MEFLSVREFAELVNISSQAIYKKIKKSNELKPFITKGLDGKLLIHKSALKLFNENLKEDAEKTNSNNNLQEQINFLQEELKAKNEIIANLTKALEREQSISMLNSKKVLLLEESNRKKHRFFNWFRRKIND